MDQFSISLNPGIRPTQFRFVHNSKDHTWHVWEYNEIEESDLVACFCPVKGKAEKMCKGDSIATVRLTAGVQPYTFKIFYDPIDSKWYIWQRDESRGINLLSKFTIWPPSTD